MMCIYTIQFIDTEWIYIGSSKNFNIRKHGHFYTLRKRKHCNAILQRLYNRLGESNMVFSILEEVEEEKNLLIREKCHIEFFLGLEKKQVMNFILDPTDMSGENHGRAKLTKKQVKEIRKKHSLKIPRKTLSEEYNVSLGTIKQIISGDIWRDPCYNHRKKQKTKLSFLIADEIREKWINEIEITQKELGVKYKISKNNISLILKNRIWKSPQYGDLSRSSFSKIR